MNAKVLYVGGCRDGELEYRDPDRLHQFEQHPVQSSAEQTRVDSWIENAPTDDELAQIQFEYHQYRLVRLPGWKMLYVYLLDTLEPHDLFHRLVACYAANVANSDDSGDNSGLT